MKITALTASGLALLAGVEAKFPTSLFGKTVCSTSYADHPVSKIKTKHTTTSEVVTVVKPWQTLTITDVVHPKTVQTSAKTHVKATKNETIYHTTRASAVHKTTTTVSLVLNSSPYFSTDTRCSITTRYTQTSPSQIMQTRPRLSV